MIDFRWYQQEAIDALERSLQTSTATLLVAAVGAGKTYIQAGFIMRMIQQFPSARFICLVHTRELVSQNYLAMIKLWPNAPAGINSASLGRRDHRSQILFCSIQSVYKQASRIGFADCIIVDECHLISPTGTTMYQQFFAEMRQINPDLRIVGMSGTPFRMDSGSLVSGDKALFDDICYEIGIGKLIEEGYLTRPVSKATSTTFDVTGVHTRGGEYIAGELERAVDKDDVTRAAVAEVIRMGADRKAWLTFCTGVEHAQHVRDEYRRQGILCEMIDGTMDKGDRSRIIEAFKRGEIRCLTNINVLSIGFDHPAIDLIALMRPTKSPSLYIQQCGRGLRLSPGKETCLILDFANVVRTLGPIDSVVVKEPGKGTGDAPVRICPVCECINHASVRVCVDCGHQFPEPEIKVNAVADVAPILSTEQPDWHHVDGQTFRYHDKVGGTPSVRIDYRVGPRIEKTWICPQHTGFAKSKADRWWAQHGGQRPFPASVDEFLDRAGELAPTEAVKIKFGGKYNEIIDFRAGERPEGTNDNVKVERRAPTTGGNLAAFGGRWSDDDIPF